MDQDRLVLGLAAVFAGLTVLLAVASLAVQPLLLLVAVPFGVVTYILWSHATGRLEEQARRRTRRRRRTADAGPRGRGGSAVGGRGGRAAAGTNRAPPDDGPPGPPPAEAYRTLGLDPGASQEAVKRAYRERVKDVHPDADGGDEEAFKRVKRAYETLAES